MPPVVIDIRSAEDSRDVVHRAVQAIVEGKLVVLPTETVYGLAASALNPAAVKKLLDSKKRPDHAPLTLAVKSLDDALDYAPGMSLLGRRLARRCWPGPITMVVEDSHPDSLLAHLPPEVRSAVAPAAWVGFRAPAHQTTLDILKMLVGPIVLTSANISGEPDAVTAEQALASLGDQVSLVLNDGQSRLGQPSTVVKVGQNSLQVLRQGVVAEPVVKRLASLMLLFVCTGNTCRSPMAELLCRKMVADRLKCELNELPDRGVLVMSAGISALNGGRPTGEAVEVMARQGLNLSDHASQQVNVQLVRHADLIFAMTRGHRQAIVSQWPEAASRTVMLCPDQVDVSDPIGSPLEAYERCAEQIRGALAARLEKIAI
jgi:protein-tyrosine phosphatase